MSELWEWAVRAYARPGVAEACLELQDAHGQNVPLLWWAVWTSRRGRVADQRPLAQAAQAARSWELAAGAHLRAARRTLKQPAPGIPDPARLAYREALKGLELAGERLLLEILEDVPTDSGEAVEADVLSGASAAWGAPLPPSAFTDLLARL